MQRTQKEYEGKVMGERRRKEAKEDERKAKQRAREDETGGE